MPEEHSVSLSANKRVVGARSGNRTLGKVLLGLVELRSFLENLLVALLANAQDGGSLDTSLLDRSKNLLGDGSGFLVV